MSRLIDRLVWACVLRITTCSAGSSCGTIDGGIYSENCAPGLSHELSQDAYSSSSLLQIGTRKEAQAASHKPSETWLKFRSLSATPINEKNTKVGLVHDAQKGVARATLPDFLFNLGLIVFQQDESVLDTVVANTQPMTLTFAGETLQMRRVIGEPAHFAQGYDALGNLNFDNYGLVSLGALKPNTNGMITVLDIGANEGAVAIAAFKKYPTKIRIIGVEPVPSTYFLLCWNLWLNAVPMFSSPENFSSQPTVPGVLVMNKGVAATDGQVLGLCYTPPATMCARICDCASFDTQNQGATQCASVVSSSFSALMKLFSASELTFLKVDCEGCENDALPALTLFSQQNPGWSVGRIAGELHTVSNQVEQIACNFEGGKWFSHVCVLGFANITDVPVEERCRLGVSRKTCEHV